MVTENTDAEKQDWKYTGKGMGGTALGLGIGALALSLLQNGGLNIFGNGGAPRPPAEQFATQRDLAYERTLSEKGEEIASLKAQLYTDQQVNALRAELNTATATQAVVNANQTGLIALLQSQVATLNSMTSPYIKQPIMAASEAALNAFAQRTGATGTTTAG